ncbi:MAG: hypothetical protein R2699_14890 [Acidimicrobiales bacterium]
MDRSVLLGTQGRLGEGIALFDNLTRGAVPALRRLLGRLGRHRGRRRGAHAEPVRRRDRDPAIAERPIYPGAAAVSDTTDPYWKAQLDSSLSVLFWAQRRFDDAVEPAARRWLRGRRLPAGRRPSGDARGRLAWSQGFTAVATPLLELARHQLVALGHHREPSQIAQALDHVA